MYVATAKHKLLRVGTKIDIDQWLKDGWIIKKGVRFHTLGHICNVIQEVTNINPVNAFDFDGYRVKMLQYYFSEKYSGKPLVEIAEFFKTRTNNLLFGKACVENWMQSDLTTIKYCEEIEDKLKAE